MVDIYKKLGITVHYMEYPGGARSAYGLLKRCISAAANFVINGGQLLRGQLLPIGGEGSVISPNFLWV